MFLPLTTEGQEIVRKIYRALWPYASMRAPVAPPSVGASVVGSGIRVGAAAPAGVSVSVALPGLGVVVPRGRFAAILVHGAATQARCLEYMRDSRHILPYLAATYSKRDGVQLDFTRGTLWTETTSETPPPSLPGCGPVFFAPPEFQSLFAKHWSERLDQAVGSIPNKLDPLTPYACEPGISSVFVRNDPTPIFSEENEFPHGWIVDGAGLVFRTSSAKFTGAIVAGEQLVGVPISPVYPARAAMAWAANFASHARGKGRGLELAPGALGQYTGGALRIPEYYRSSASRRNDWWVRLVRWYHRAAWLVFAGESMRGHSMWRVQAAPLWWRSHCAAWGVGIVTPLAVASKGIAKTKSGSSDRLSVSESPAEMESILRYIVRHTAVPGSPGSLGDQIVPADLATDGKAKYRRALLDIPPAAGSIDPPYSIADWRIHAVSNWGAHEAALDNAKFNAFSAIITMEASLCGAGFGSAVTAPIVQGLSMYVGASVAGLVSKVVSLAVQNAFRAGQSGDVHDFGNWGDVVGLFGEAVDVIGAGAGDFAELIPEDTWQTLQTAGQAFAGFGSGVDFDALIKPLNRIRNAFNELRDDWGWPYIDEAYGGLGLADAAKSAAGGVANLLK